MTTVVTQGCLVTSKPDFASEADCLPSFVTSDAVPPFNQIALLTPSATSTTFTASVPLRTCAHTREYRAYVWLDKSFIVPQPAINPEEKDLRTVNIVIPASSFGSVRGCHRVELYVSSSIGPDFKRVQIPGDLAYAVWWVNLNVDGGPILTLEDCPR